MRRPLVVLAIALALSTLAFAAHAAEARPDPPCWNGADCPVPPICVPGQLCCRYPEPCAPPQDP